MIYWIYLFSLLLLSLLIGIFRPKILGIIGEKKVSAILNLLDKDKYMVLNDLMIENEDGTTSQIDHLILSIYGIFVIETKNYSGLIYGDEYSQYWTKNMYGHKYKFMNPIRQNYGHIKSVSNKLHLSEDKFIPIVVFSANATIKNKYKSDVVYILQLNQTIKKYNTVILSDIELDNYKNILVGCLSYTRKQANEHVQEIHSKIENTNEMISKGICPKCNGKLILRNGKYGQFYGCSNYPKCKFIYNGKKE